jgi:hypothetical protein
MPGSVEEDQALIEAYESGLSIKVMVRRFERGSAGIEVRLVKLGFPTRPPGER